jgi:hypothetical protein
MAYLNEIEKETIEWFKGLIVEGQGRVESTRLDPLGWLILALPPDPPEESTAWLAYIAAQAPGKKAVVNLAEHGIIVLILPRYAKAKQEALPFKSGSGPQGRQSSLGLEEGPQLGASEGQRHEEVEESTS